MTPAAPVIAPLCIEPLIGRLIEQTGYKAAYIGGGALGYSLAVSEAMFTLTEMAVVTRQITQRVSIPVLVDATVGFGDAIHTVRTIWELESAGAAGVELGDQVAPKRAHHHKGVDHLVSKNTFVEKVREAAHARRDSDFLIIARTGAARIESLESALDRAHAYVEAGADALLLAGVSEVENARVRAEFDVPLVLMGRHTVADATALGASLVLDPFTTQVVMFKAAKEALRAAARGDNSALGEEFMPTYREIAEVSGIQQLWDIEARTTEKELYG